MRRASPVNEARETGASLILVRRRANELGLPGKRYYNTWKNLSPVCRDLGTAIPGSPLTCWPGCHVIARLIFVAFNKRAEITAN